MKKYYFNVSGFPASTFHQPLNGTLVLSDAAVASGVAKLSDISSLTVTAGAALPDSDAVTLAYIDTTSFVNHSVKLSPDRNSVAALSADDIHGGQVDFFLFFQTFHQTPAAGVVENVVRVYADHIEVETDYVPPISPEVYLSEFSGAWLDTNKQLPWKNPYAVAIDPLALLLSNETYVMLHLPDPPPIEVIQELIRGKIAAMSTEEYARALARVRKMKTFVDDLEKEFSTQLPPPG
jgi:hypothetical protein